MKTWTNEETAALIENYNRVSNEEFMKLIPNKSFIAIYKKARSLGLYKAKELIFINRSQARKGEKGSNWKGGTATTAKGYRLIKAPNHERADNKGYVLEHILVFERETGVKVPKNCCIHHLNGNKSDNRIENLCLMLTSAHTMHHNLGRKHSDETKRKISEKAKERKKI